MRMTYVVCLVLLACFLGDVFIPLDASSGWTIFAYFLSHGSWWHLTFNLIAVLTFGIAIERRLGAWPMLLIFTAGAWAGGVIHASQSAAPVIGASAGAYALITVFCLLVPQQRVWLLFIPMRALTMLIVAIAATLLSLQFGWAANIAHWAHLGGMIVGAIWVTCLSNKGE